MDPELCAVCREEPAVDLFELTVVCRICLKVLLDDDNNAHGKTAQHTSMAFLVHPTLLENCNVQ